MNGGRTITLLLLSLGAVTALPGQRRAPAQHAWGPAVAPDGRTIAFLSSHEGALVPFAMNADGSGIHRLANERGLAQLQWAGDGRLLATRRAGDTTVVMSLALDGGPTTAIARIVAFPGGAVPFPDAERFVYGVGSWQKTQLESSRADGSDRRRLTSDDAAYWCPQVSPAGDRIATGRVDDASWQLWVVNADGTGGRGIVRVTRGGGSTECPKWSFDGTRIAFMSGMRVPEDTSRTTSHIWVVEASGGQPVKLAPHATPWHDEAPSWFPDGKRIAFHSDRTGAWEIWIMNADGSGQRQLTSSAP